MTLTLEQVRKLKLALVESDPGDLSHDLTSEDIDCIVGIVEGVLDAECVHEYRFLQEETIDESGYRPGRDVFHVFHCVKCMKHDRVFVRHEEQSRERFGYDVTRRAY